MKHMARQVRSTLLNTIMAGVGIGFATAASAAGAGVGVDAGAGAQVAAPPSSSRAGVAADAHMSPYGTAHNNAQWQDGAPRGAERATERLSTTGADMNNSADSEREAAGKTSLKGKR